MPLLRLQWGLPDAVPPDATGAWGRAWRKCQAEERLACGSGWTDTGLVFTREDGTALSPQWVSVRFESLAYRSGLPAIRFHDLRHGAASLSKAARQDTKIISDLLGHHRASFTEIPDPGGGAGFAFAHTARLGSEKTAFLIPFCLILSHGTRTDARDTGRACREPALELRAAGPRSDLSEELWPGLSQPR